MKGSRRVGLWILCAMVLLSLAVPGVALAAGPEVMISTPLWSLLHPLPGPTAATGTASDDVAVTVVEVYIYSEDAAGYWDPATDDFTATAEVWMTATTSDGWANWSIDLSAVDWFEDYFVIAARASDGTTWDDHAIVCRVGTAGTCEFTGPAGGSTVGPRPTISISAADAESGINEVVIYLSDPWTELYRDNTAPYQMGPAEWDAFIAGGGSPLAEGPHTIQALAWNGAMWPTWADPLSITVDASGPAVVLTSPADGYSGVATPSITGTASDGAGVSEVRVCLAKEQLNGSLRYWHFLSGVGWGWYSAAEVWNVATTSNAWADWSFPMPSGEGHYQVQATAIDSLGNQSYSNVHSFMVGTPPVCSVAAPLDGAVVTTGRPTVTVNADDPECGINNAQIMYSTDWDGSSGTWSLLANVTAFPTPFTVNWSTTPASGITFLDGVVALQVQAVSEAALAASSTVSTFTVDTLPPVVDFTGLADGATLASAPAVIQGTAGDAGTGVHQVLFTIQRVSDGRVWDPLTGGGSWVPGPYLAFSLPGTTSWQYPTSAWLTSDGTYAVTAAASDYLSQETAVTRTFTYIGTPPGAPTGLAVSTAGQTSLAIDWSDSSEFDLAGYNIYAGTTETGTFTKLNNTLLTNSEYRHDGLTAGVTRWYYVTAVDQAAIESVASAKGSGQTELASSPAPPPRIGPALRSGVRMVLTIGNAVADINGVPREFDAPPFVTPGGRTMVPIRFVSEALGALVLWNPYTQQVTIRGDWTEIVLTVGSPVAMVNGQPVELDAPVVLTPAPEWRSYIPFRFICETLGAEVHWDGTARTVTIQR